MNSSQAVVALVGIAPLGTPSGVDFGDQSLLATILSSYPEIFVVDGGRFSLSPSLEPCSGFSVHALYA